MVYSVIQDKHFAFEEFANLEKFQILRVECIMHVWPKMRNNIPKLSILLSSLSEHGNYSYH